MGKSKCQVSQSRAIYQRGCPSHSPTHGHQSSRSQPPVAIVGSNTPLSTSSVVLPVTTSTVSQSSSALFSLINGLILTHHWPYSHSLIQVSPWTSCWQLFNQRSTIDPIPTMWPLDRRPLAAPPHMSHTPHISLTWKPSII